MPTRISRPISLLSCLAAAATALNAQTINLKGRVLDKANMEPVAGASVKVAGSGLAAVTGADGRFALKGDPTGLRPSPRMGFLPAAPFLRDGDLWFEALTASQPVRVEILGASGRTLEVREFRSANAGWNHVGLSAWPEENFLGFARITTGGDSFLRRVMRLGNPGGQGLARSDAALSARRGQAKVAAGQVDVSMAKLLPKSVPYAADDADLGDIVLEYPARAAIGVGASMPYGAYVLFDGTKGKAAAAAELKAKWQDWTPAVNETELAKYTAAKNTFKIAKDPAFPKDTNRVTLQSCCNRLWGYDDIQAIKTHADAQLHVEFNLMGEYDSTENANASDPISPNYSPGYNNSGVYIQSRHEIQILSWNQDSTKLPDSHGMGCIVNEYVPIKNANKANGVWQSYDITYRSARFDAGGNKTANAYTTVWWNGVLVHDNRETKGAATGLANHSGEELNATLYGLKLQSEGTDVRYRNIWIKDLNIKDAQTKFGY
ncbi:MAG: hypothetical protein JWP91_4336 [Fibrobacteres bacterium]|nr:hypothetical protein [Fibrobacterota bacterium]